MPATISHMCVGCVAQNVTQSLTHSRQGNYMYVDGQRHQFFELLIYEHANRSEQVCTGAARTLGLRSAV
jgi:prepilin-type processing-associated H-X9-DG protein